MKMFTAELVGTALLVLLGDGVVAGVLLNRSKAEKSGWIVITTGWALAVAMAVYAVGQVSGAHINPAVTLSLAAVHKLAWADVPSYLLGQFAGAFLGAVLVWLAYLAHWSGTEDKALKLAVFATAPANRRRGGEDGELQSLVLSAGPMREIRQPHQHRAEERARKLAQEVAGHVSPGKLVDGCQAQRYRRINVGAAHLPDRVNGHRHGQRPSRGDHDPAGLLSLRSVEQHTRHHAVAQQDQKRRAHQLSRKHLHRVPPKNWFALGSGRSASSIYAFGRNSRYIENGSAAWEERRSTRQTTIA